MKKVLTKWRNVLFSALIVGSLCIESTTTVSAADTMSDDFGVVENFTEDTNNAGIVPYAEEWWGPANKQKVAGCPFTFTDCNTTPIKHITTSGWLYLHVNFEKADSYAGNIKLTVNIKKSNGEQLTNDVYYTYNVDEQTAWTHVSAGDEIQIFFDASTNGTPSAHYRKAKVTYYYTLLAD